MRDRIGWPWLALAVVAVAGAGCAGPPRARDGEILGYGTKGVESYLPAGQEVTLAELRARCAQIGESGPPRPQSLAAACDQLQRTLHNQPGGALR